MSLAIDCAALPPCPDASLRSYQLLVHQPPPTLRQFASHMMSATFWDLWTPSLPLVSFNTTYEFSWFAKICRFLRETWLVTLMLNYSTRLIWRALTIHSYLWFPIHWLLRYDVCGWDGSIGVPQCLPYSSFKITIRYDLIHSYLINFLNLPLPEDASAAAWCLLCLSASVMSWLRWLGSSSGFVVIGTKGKVWKNWIQFDSNSIFCWVFESVRFLIFSSDDAIISRWFLRDFYRLWH